MPEVSLCCLKSGDEEARSQTHFNIYYYHPTERSRRKHTFHNYCCSLCKASLLLLTSTVPFHLYGQGFKTKKKQRKALSNVVGLHTMAKDETSEGMKQRQTEFSYNFQDHHQWNLRCYESDMSSRMKYSKTCPTVLKITPNLHLHSKMFHCIKVPQILKCVNMKFMTCLKGKGAHFFY